jgi:hypothetical protein
MVGDKHLQTIEIRKWQKGERKGGQGRKGDMEERNVGAGGGDTTYHPRSAPRAPPAALSPPSPAAPPPPPAPPTPGSLPAAVPRRPRLPAKARSRPKSSLSSFSGNKVQTLRQAQKNIDRQLHTQKKKQSCYEHTPPKVQAHANT